ncbi:MAG: NAD(P)/FAD-dependent oxidoreductase [Proteobacteria bacterium]|nr:NAD(P)/FAD-dependent oxidoreductase [Pseudomonadota bacterium]
MSTNAPTDFPIAIIGAGFSGVGTAIQLKKAGIDSFTIFERAGDVGGTWRDNTYPGAACDVPSHAYSLSFEQSHTWSRRFAESGEIHEYLRSVTHKWKLREHTRFNTEIVDARFDEETGSWTLTTGDDETFTARVVVSCAGGLVNPAWPDIKGLQSFTGELFHTARWNHDYDLAGRRVAVIGTGASAVQVVPSIANQVEQLDVYQRTPAWVVPKRDKVYSERFKRLLGRFRFLLRASRLIKYWLSELFGPVVFLDNERLANVGQRGSLMHLREQVKSPELRKKLRPDFQFGCKRILISDEYWSSFEKPNVELVTDPIEEIRSDGIQTKDGSIRPLDAIIIATGFDLGFTSAPFPITGLGGRSLDDAWEDGAVAYKGMSVSGFPNWFILMGPNTGPGHTSVLVYTEAQMAHTVSAIKKLRNEGLRYVNVRQEVQNRYNDGLQGRMKHMVWSTGCNSWYLSKDGANHSLYPGYAAEYALRARHFKTRDYQLVR